MTKPQKPTGSELEILHVLWERGPSTVRDVHEAISTKKPLGYTSVLKLLQIMTTKGLVRRDEQQRADFVAEYQDGINKIFTPRADGRIIFPFQRLFFVAYRK